MNDPQTIGDILAGPMSRLDGCPSPSCLNTETPTAAIPTVDGWQIAYKCADCSTVWVAETGKIGAQVKTAPRAGCANNQRVPQGLADADRSAN